MAILTNMDDPTEIIHFHGEMSADWEDSVEVTDHAVPEGAPATAHKERKPRTYSLRVIMNDSPFEGQAVVPAPPGSRFDSLMEAWLERNLLARLRYWSLSTGGVDDVHLTSARRGRTNVGRTIYDLQLKKVRQARAESVRLPPPRRQRKPTTTPPAVTTGAPTPTPEAPAPWQSANHRIWVYGGGPVTYRKDSLKYRLTNTNWAVGESTPSPEAAELYRSYIPAGPAPVSAPAAPLYSPIPP